MLLNKQQNKYRNIELIILTVIIIFWDVISIVFFSQDLDKTFYASITPIILVIGVMRWGYYGALPFIVAKLVFSLYLGIFNENIGVFDAIFIHGIPYIIVLFVIPIIEILRKRFLTSIWIRWFIVALIFISMFIGRAIAISIVLNESIINTFMMELAYNLFSFVVVCLIIMMTSNVPNLYKKVNFYETVLEKNE